MDLWQKHLVIVPMCVNFHWTVGVIHLDIDSDGAEHNTIEILDPIYPRRKEGREMQQLVVRRKSLNIKKYLQAEFKDKKGRSMTKDMVNSYKFSYPTVPYQSNECDCGVFSLMYAFAACHQMQYTSFKKIHAKPFRKHILASVMAGKVLDIIRYPDIKLN